MSNNVAVNVFCVLSILGSLSACSLSQPASAVVPAGVWGGDHISMTVADAGSHLELDCAHGDIPIALDLDRRNRFSVAGTFVREHGGPIRDGEAPESHPALYDGALTLNSLALSIRLTDTGDDLGEFTLTRSVTGHVVKCL